MPRADRSTPQTPPRAQPRDNRDIPQSHRTNSTASTAGNAGRSKPTKSDLTSGGTMPQYDAGADDASMKAAASHSKYMHHDGKANAPMPFGAGNAGGAPDMAGSESPGDGKDAPAPFNTTKGKPMNVKGKDLSTGKSG